MTLYLICGVPFLAMVLFITLDYFTSDSEGTGD